MSLRATISRWLAGTACLLASSGCSDGRPEIVPVSGQVLLDGQPLTHGFVRFAPTGTRASTGKLDGEGRFVLSCMDDGDGAIIGEHKVEVIASEVLTSTTMKWHAPKKYADGGSSGLSFEVPSDGTDSATFNLSWDGGKPYVETIGGGSQATKEAAVGPFGAAN
jgi:hypothetical protein